MEIPMNHIPQSTRISEYSLNRMGEWGYLKRTIATDDPVTCAIYARENGLVTSQDGNDSSPWLKMRKSLHKWLIKLN
jgi:hypothetical protein